MKLLEDMAKAALAAHGLPVPRGQAASDTDDIGAIALRVAATDAANDGGTSGLPAQAAVIVKALVPTGRRGKAGFVQRCEPSQAAQVARAMIGRDLAGYRVTQVYIEQVVPIAAEYYLSFSFAGLAMKVLASREGGVDIEQTVRERPQAVVSRDIDPLAGLRIWQAAALWESAGVESARIPALAEVTVRLFQAFQRCDGQMLEINPLVVTGNGAISLVGAMLELDDNALHRHPDWEKLAAENAGPGGRPLTAGERAVSDANRRFAGGATRYIELDGEIGLLVSGGGASLYQHDLILHYGGRPANHTDFSPTPTPDKHVAVLDAIFAKPGVRGLLIGSNFLQLARCDLIIEALAISLRKNGIDTTRFPIVIRLFGPMEDEARALAAQFDGIDYLPRGASLAVACETIVSAVRRSQESRLA